MKKRAAFLILGLALAAALVAILVYRGDSGSAGRRDRVIAIFKTAGTANAFWLAVRDGVESGAKDFGFEVSFRAPRDEIYVDEQIQILREAILERPAAIVLAAGDYQRLVEPVREAKDKGIRVVCLDSFIESEDADAKVGTDNFEAGQKCGAALLSRLPTPAPGGRGSPEPPRVAVMSYVQGSSTAIGRESGIQEALLGRAMIIETSYSSSEAGRAYEQAKAILAREPDLAGIAALNLPTTLGAAQALAESGRQGKVVLVGFDNSPEVMRQMERGVIRDAIVQKPFNMGYLSMQVAREILSGKRPKAYTNTGSVDIDRENMFEPGNQKLLFPVAAN
jgi:ribose transport system substrate-binding protein